MDNIIVKNVKLKWAHLAEPNTQGDYASGKYEVSVVLTAEQAEQVKGAINARQKIKTDKDGDLTVTLKSSVKPIVVDKNGMAYSPDMLKKLGNGTVANVRINLYQSRGMTFAGIGAIKVKDFKEYVSKADTSDLDDEDTTSAEQSLGDLEDDE